MVCTASAKLPAPFGRALRSDLQPYRIDLRARRAQTKDGTEGVIELMFDLDGDETDDPFLAETFVVRWPGGLWSSEDCDDFHISGRL